MAIKVIGCRVCCMFAVHGTTLLIEHILPSAGKHQIFTRRETHNQHSYDSTDHVLSTVPPQGFVWMHFGPRNLLHLLLLLEYVSRAKAPFLFCNEADREGLGLLTAVHAKVYQFHLGSNGVANSIGHSSNSHLCGIRLRQPMRRVVRSRSGAR